MAKLIYLALHEQFGILKAVTAQCSVWWCLRIKRILLNILIPNAIEISKWSRRMAGAISKINGETEIIFNLLPEATLDTIVGLTAKITTSFSRATLNI